VSLLYESTRPIYSELEGFEKFLFLFTINTDKLILNLKRKTVEVSESELSKSESDDMKSETKFSSSTSSDEESDEEDEEQQKYVNIQISDQIMSIELMLYKNTYWQIRNQISKPSQSSSSLFIRTEI
jgi:hypothetical protein